MVLEEDIKNFSRKYNLPVDYVRREIEEQDRFVSEVFDTEPEMESDPEVAKRIMAEYVRRSETATVPYVRYRYLYESAVIAAMYIYAHVDDWQTGIIPDFYEEAMEHADTALMSIAGYFDVLLVSNMLKLYTLKDVQEIIDCMKEVNRFVHWAKKHSTYYISQYRQSELYRRYEFVCLQASYKLSNDESIDLTQKIRLFKYLKKLKNNKILMRVYFMLFKFYVENLERDDLNAGLDDINDSSGYAYFEEYLAKAYSAMGYKLESLNIEECSSHLIWLIIATEYANWMCIEHTGPIPYNPVEAKRILQFAAKSSDENITSRANAFLQKYFNE